MTTSLDRLADPVRAALERCGCIATADPHQAYQIRLAWAERQRQAGLTSWPTPDVLPLTAALSRAWRGALFDGADLPALLNPAQERALWEQVVREAGGERRFLQPHGTARAAMRAWRRLIEWKLKLSTLAGAPGEEARAFHQWARAFLEHCRARHWIDAASALEQWPLEREEPRPWVLVGFDTPSVAVRSLGERMQQRGIEVQFSAGPVESGARVVSASFSDSQDEWRAAACWARERLGRDPGQRLQVVIADLERERDRIERVFDEILRPVALVGGATPRIPFAIEGGIALARYPLVETALLAISLAVEPQPFEVASRWLRSPFLATADCSSADRARLDLSLRRNAPHELDLSGLQHALERAATRLGIGEPLIGAGRALATALAGRHGLAHWSGAVSRGLRELGWPGAVPLDSAQRQTLEKFNDCLAQLAMLDDIVGTVDARGLLHHLRALAEQTRFQPETGDAPLTLSARLADPALQLDGLWVCGLHSGAWPRAARADPFLPWGLQLEAGMPEASAPAMLAQAERLTTRWAESAREVIFSWPARLDDEEGLPSPLISAYPTDPDVGRAAASGGGFWRRVRDSARLQELDDSQAPPLRAGAPISSAFALTLQSWCAIRAFADRRLLAQPVEQPQPGIDPRTRGTLTHESLALLWGELGTQERLHALDDAGRAALVASMVARASAKHLPPWRWPARLRSLEGERLAALLHEWLALESGRPPFRVVALEQSVPAELAGHPLQLRIDRVDERTGDGRRQLLDYKTGVVTPAAWFGERPEDAQLPLYAIAVRPPVEGIAIAQVRPGECTLAGESSAPGMTGNRRPIDWEAQLRAWQGTLERLAHDFAGGDARVNPKLPVTCRHCKLHSLCRIDELRGALYDEEIEAGSDGD